MPRPEPTTAEHIASYFQLGTGVGFRVCRLTCALFEAFVKALTAGPKPVLSPYLFIEIHEIIKYLDKVFDHVHLPSMKAGVLYPTITWDKNTILSEQAALSNMLKDLQQSVHTLTIHQEDTGYNI
ncbi:hypothetical protein DAEQUDRAFT_742037 [Daedalea quercina L-15889]|uniref:Uncharacterized protein n=1 Tax=Daedalea quercina L-15889 TaxID=1314783 RepID=A0A165KJT1_9APHY|nr:hypothetical protein DAEQUDRAFT_742037 [Daedalea quercina L-15889]